MKSLGGFLKRKQLERQLERPPVLVETPVLGTDVSVLFSVHTWIEYHNRARDSFTGEPDMIDWLKTILRPGDILWDIGANVGLYTCYAAKTRGCRVLAFEPSVFNLECLARNVFLNQLTGLVTILPLALSDATALTTLNLSTTEWGGALSSFGQRQAER